MPSITSGTRTPSSGRSSTTASTSPSSMPVSTSATSTSTSASRARSSRSFGPTTPSGFTTIISSRWPRRCAAAVSRTQSGSSCTSPFRQRRPFSPSPSMRLLPRRYPPMTSSGCRRAPTSPISSSSWRKVFPAALCRTGAFASSIGSSQSRASRSASCPMISPISVLTSRTARQRKASCAPSASTDWITPRGCRRSSQPSGAFWRNTPPIAAR